MWNQSIPCILPPADKIPIAKYKNKEFGKEAEKYRKGLAKKYGTKKQLISGIHYNFSLDENSIKKLFENYSKKISYKEFKDQVYLKIVRNYLRYKWLVIYITGASNGADETFIKECLNLTTENDQDNGYYNKKQHHIEIHHVDIKI